LFRRPDSDDLASIGAGFWPEIDDVIGFRDHTEIVFDHDHGVAFIHEPMKHIEQQLDVSHVQTDGRFLEQVQCRSWLAHLSNPLVRSAIDSPL
jgi:hypothetical protein